MDLQGFGQRHRLKIIGELKAAKHCQLLDGKAKPDVEHVPGRRGWIRADKGSFRVAVMGMKAINPVIAELKRLGFEGCGRGDREVMRFFDPANEAQAAFAIKVIGARKRRQVHLSETQRQRLREMGFRKTRQAPKTDSVSEVPQLARA
jgi:hypothetical protein